MTEDDEKLETEKEPEPAMAAAGRKPPLPQPLEAFGWLWLLGAGLIGLLGVLIVWSCIWPSEALLARAPKGDPSWGHFWFFGITGLVLALAYLWLWHRMAVRRSTAPWMWSTGAGMLLMGAAFLLIMGWAPFSLCLLVALGVWCHSITRKHFART